MAKDYKLTRRMAGLLKARLPDLGLRRIPDPRKARGKRWKLPVIIKNCLAAMMGGCKSLAQAEALSAEMSPAISKMLGIERRVPDTTMRNILVKLSPSELRRHLRALAKSAFRRKALNHEGLPFGVVSIDGKYIAIDQADNRYAQEHQYADKIGSYGLLRTLTCTLVSSTARPCLDAVPIPAVTNEMGHFSAALKSMVKNFKKLFQVVSTDAGMCSLDNAQLVIDAKKDYLFCIKKDQPSLLAEAQRLLRFKRKPLAETTDIVGKYEVTRRLYKTDEIAGFLNWRHLRTTLRVESTKIDLETGERVAHESRYFISSLQSQRLSDKQWLLMIRQHWGVEVCHNILDTVFEEDDHPWILKDPRGALNVMLLRRIAYNMMTLFRSVTQRSDVKRQMPWKDIIRAMYNALISCQESDVFGLRVRHGVAIIG
jgi:hypothetical protein